MKKLFILVLAGIITFLSVSIAQDTTKEKISTTQKAPPKTKGKLSKTHKNRDVIIDELNNVAADAYQFYLKPVAMGGGGRSYEHYKIPAKVFKGVKIKKSMPFEIVFEKGGVQCAVDSTARVTYK